MQNWLPQSADELAAAMNEAARGGSQILLKGGGTKDGMAGPLCSADVTIRTTGMSKVLIFEPRDLTVSVETGMLWSELGVVLGRHGLSIPLDPPYAASATVGGVVASNSSGPRRRGYGTARDAVIGMRFATLEGKLVQTGGMVVKNVAGLDMGKLMIGSFGTLAAIASVNFKLTPIPVASRTFSLDRLTADQACGVRDRILQSVLQPVAIDLFNAPAAARLGFAGYLLLVQASGSAAALERWSTELSDFRSVEDSVWDGVREFTPAFLREHPDGVVVRTSSTLTGTLDELKKGEEPVVARAGSGVLYRHFTRRADLLPSSNSVVEFAPQSIRANSELWPDPGMSFGVMEKVKGLFDPNRLLNRGRLYGRL